MEFAKLHAGRPELPAAQVSYGGGNLSGKAECEIRLLGRDGSPSSLGCAPNTRRPFFLFLAEAEARKGTASIFARSAPLMNKRTSELAFRSEDRVGHLAKHFTVKSNRPETSTLMPSWGAAHEPESVSVRGSFQEFRGS